MILQTQLLLLLLSHSPEPTGSPMQFFSLIAEEFKEEDSKENTAESRVLKVDQLQVEVSRQCDGLPANFKGRVTFFDQFEAGLNLESRPESRDQLMTEQLLKVAREKSPDELLIVHTGGHHIVDFYTASFARGIPILNSSVVIEGFSKDNPFFLSRDGEALKRDAYVRFLVNLCYEVAAGRRDVLFQNLRKAFEYWSVGPVDRADIILLADYHWSMALADTILELPSSKELLGEDFKGVSLYIEGFPNREIAALDFIETEMKGHASYHENRTFGFFLTRLKDRFSISRQTTEGEILDRPDSEEIFDYIRQYLANVENSHALREELLLIRYVKSLQESEPQAVNARVFGFDRDSFFYRENANHIKPDYFPLQTDREAEFGEIFAEDAMVGLAKGFPGLSREFWERNILGD